MMGDHPVSGDLAIAPATTVQPALSSRTATSDKSSSQTTDTTATASALSGPPPVNPGLHLDPALNIVVLQFYDSKGNVTQTIPSQKQLQAYQQGAGQKASDSSPQQATKPTAPK
jgi:hypothetical protein